MQFHLIPFEKHLSSLYELQGEMFFDEDFLWVVYTLNGNLSLLEIPPQAVMPQRKDQLWESTCFELFIKKPHSSLNPSYVEFNFSPSGDYNCYCFEDYRLGMKEPNLNSPLAIKVWSEGRQIQVIAKIPFDLIFNLFKIASGEKGIFQFAASAVLLSKDNQKSYWALVHKGEKPDFHREDGFQLQMELNALPKEKLPLV